MQRARDISENLARSGDTRPHMTPTVFDAVHVAEHNPEQFHQLEYIETEYKPTVGALKYIFITAVVFLILSVGYFLYAYSNPGGSVSKERVTVSLIGNSYVSSGESKDYEFVKENSNESALQNEVALLSVPSNSGNANTVVKKDIGLLKAGEQKKIVFNNVVLYGSQFEDKIITATLEYSFVGSRAVLQQTSELPIRIDTSPIALSLDAPSIVSVNQNNTYTITLTSTTDLRSTGIHIEYPENFVVTSTSPEPSAGNYLWEFDSIKKGKPITITVRGNANTLTRDGTPLSLRVTAGTLSRDDSLLGIIYATAIREFISQPAQLSATLLVGGSSVSPIALHQGSEYTGSVSLVNNTASNLRTVTATMQFTGNAIEYASLRAPNGFYDSAKKQIVWSSNDKATDLANLPPGQTVSYDFNFAVPNRLQTSDTSELFVTLTGIDVNGNVIVTERAASLKFVQNATLSLLQNTRYFEGPFENSGPTPPEVDTTTTYTITWTLPRQVIAFDNASVSAVLPLWVSWNNAFSPDKSDISYNSVSREITWRAGSVSPEVARDPSVSFQIKVTPTVGDIGNVIDIVKNVSVSAKNSLTGQLVDFTSSAHTTNTNGDAEESSGTVKSKS